MITMLDASSLTVLLFLVFKRTRLLGIAGLTLMFHYYPAPAFAVAVAGAAIISHYEDTH